MSSFDLNNQAAAGIPTPTTGNTTLFVDTDKLLKGKDDAGAITNYGASGNAISALTGQVTASGPGSAVATVANSAVIGKVLTGLVSTTGTISATDTILQAFGKLVSKNNVGFYPYSSDGNVVISANTNLVKDMYYETLVVNSGATLFTNGFRIFAKTSIENNGTIDRSGSDASGTAATTGLSAGTLAAGAAGGAGGAAAGSAGGASATSLGGAGGAGGLGSGGAGGAAGTKTDVTTNSGGIEIFQNYNRAVIGQNLIGGLVTGGAGGGGAGGDGVAGGAGGAGGGLVIMCSPNIFGTGAIRAKGGNGFTPITGGNKGGGGGGGGGTIVVISENDTLSTSLTLDVSGGTGVSGTGTGVSGSNGSSGRIYRLRA